MRSVYNHIIGKGGWPSLSVTLDLSIQAPPTIAHSRPRAFLILHTPSIAFTLASMAHLF